MAQRENSQAKATTREEEFGEGNQKGKDQGKSKLKNSENREKTTSFFYDSERKPYYK